MDKRQNNYESLPAAIRAALEANPEEPLQTPATETTPATTTANAATDAQRAARYAAAVPAAGEGQRNATAYALAFKLAELFRLSGAEILDACRDWNARCVPPLSEGELAATVRSATTRASREGKTGAKWTPVQTKGTAPKKTTDAKQNEEEPAEGKKEKQNRFDYQAIARRFLTGNGLGEPGPEVRLRYYRQSFHVWTSRHWEEQNDDDFAARATGWLQTQEDCANRVSRTLVSNVLQNLRGLVRLDSTWTVPFWAETGARAPRMVAMENGILDLDALLTGRPDALQPHTARFFNVVSLPYPFKPTAKAPRYDAFLCRVQPDQEVRRLLTEWLGYCLVYDTRLQRFLLLQGEGSNGKSVYSAVLKAVIGRGNFSAVSLSAFTAERSFQLVPSIGRLANIQTDLDFVAPKEEGRLKAFVSGEEVEIEKKGKDPIIERPTARLTFACNPPPAFRDRSRGVWRRLLYVRFREQISDAEANPDMTEPTWWAEQGELPGIFNAAVAGLRDLLARGRFDEPAVCRFDKDEYRNELNPAAVFLADHCLVCPCALKGAPCGDIEHTVWTGDLYDSYKAWLRDSGHDHKDQLSKAYFGREVRRAFPQVKLSQQPRRHVTYRRQLIAGLWTASDEVEKEVRDRRWMGLIFNPDGVATASQPDADDQAPALATDGAAAAGTAPPHLPPPPPLDLDNERIPI